MEKRSTNRVFGGKFAAVVSVILSLCLIGMLAVNGTIFAQAADSFDSSKPCSITVKMPNPDDPTYADQYADMPSTPDLVYDLYQIASAKPSTGYDAYTFAVEEGSPFSSIAGDFTDLNSEKYKEIAQKALSIVKDAEIPHETADMGSTVRSLNAGLYLVVVHKKGTSNKASYITGQEGSLATMAKSTTDVFTFSPEVIAVPGRYSAEKGNHSANAGINWQYDVTATLKPVYHPLYGYIEIEKVLENFNQDGKYIEDQELEKSATFVFRIDGYESANPAPGEKPVYSNVKSIVFKGAGTQSITVDNIPAGLYVKVTEVYSGATYELVRQTPEGLVKVEAPQPGQSYQAVKFVFENKYNDTGNGGGSVNNSFSYTSDDESSGSGNASSDHSVQWVWSKDGEVQQ